MEQCKKYLREAKAKNWAIDFADLMERFNLTKEQVRQCVNEVYV